VRAESAQCLFSVCGRPSKNMTAGAEARQSAPGRLSKRE
jgi:hypothetical protein